MRWNPVHMLLTKSCALVWVYLARGKGITFYTKNLQGSGMYLEGIPFSNCTGLPHCLAVAALCAVGTQYGE